MRLNSHSRLNLIMALQQAIRAGADEAVMLDPHGFVSSCNATNLFWVRGGEVRTSTGVYCFNGVTRGVVIDCCRAGAAPLAIGDFPLEDLHAADEAFVTGTFGGRDAGAIGGRPRSGVASPRAGHRAPDRRLRRAQGCRGGAMNAPEPLRIAMWSGPRNISTAMMRAFENRPDTAVVDEPFYAAYLAASARSTPCATRFWRASPPTGERSPRVSSGRRRAERRCSTRSI